MIAWNVIKMGFFFWKKSFPTSLFFWPNFDPTRPVPEFFRADPARPDPSTFGKLANPTRPDPRDRQNTRPDPRVNIFWPAASLYRNSWKAKIMSKIKKVGNTANRPEKVFLNISRQMRMHQKYTITIQPRGQEWNYCPKGTYYCPSGEATRAIILSSWGAIISFLPKWLVSNSILTN